LLKVVFFLLVLTGHLQIYQPVRFAGRI
jgi:hypothetical protein